MIYETNTVPVARIPDMKWRPEFTESPWRISRPEDLPNDMRRDHAYFWRISDDGTIFTVRVDTGEARSF